MLLIMYQLKSRDACSAVMVIPCRLTIKAAWRHYSNVLESLINWEQKGIPKSAGLSSSKDFDLSQMRNLLRALDNPHLLWPAVHVAGSKGHTQLAFFTFLIVQKTQWILQSQT
jgi:hypothetical protein